MYDVGTNSDFVYVTGGHVRANSDDFKAWLPKSNEPNHLHDRKQEHAVASLKSGDWRTRNPSKRYHVICEHEGLTLCRNLSVVSRDSTIT